LEECEDEPSDALQNYLLPELIFADHVEAYCAAGGAQRATALNTEPVLDQLRSKDDSFWRQLLAKWVVEAPVAEIVMKPSKALVKTRAAAEKLGVEQRRRALGEEGLRSCKIKLEEALTANAPQPLPTLADGRMVLAPVPPASSIPMLPLKVKCLKMSRTLCLRGGPEQESSSSSSSSSSSHVTVQLVRTSTMLHTVCVGFDCRRVPAHLRPWLVLMQVLYIYIYQTSVSTFIYTFVYIMSVSTCIYIHIYIYTYIYICVCVLYVNVHLRSCRSLKTFVPISA
jgi:Zn-dependent M16 (insulinase) family peptidase